ncbi:MAG: chorismate synthase [actinobacterium acAMD-5]|nr:MAG: chorismate synthase [actinobacterium acAMD-5]
MLRWITAGESHGPSLTAVIEGMPAGISINTEMIADQLMRRRLGVGRGARMKFERDEVTISGGVRHGVTMGGPIAIAIANTEWPKWQQVMSADPIDESLFADLARNAPLTRPRPGHADLTGMQKYGFDDARPVLERASARETASRVALGSVAKAFLTEIANVEILSHVISIGKVSVPKGTVPTQGDLPKIDEDPVRCLNTETSIQIQELIDIAHKAGDTLGGVVEVVVYGLPPGLGSYVHSDRRIDAKLAGALMGIQAIKGVEIGDGFETTRNFGSAAHDEINIESGKIKRSGNRSGGTEGGMTTGEVLRVRAAMKPISTVPKALKTIDTNSLEPALAHNQRSDVCAVPAAGVVAEAMVALVLADAFLEKFGGDSVQETKRNLDSYLSNLKLS